MFDCSFQSWMRAQSAEVNGFSMSGRGQWREWRQSNAGIGFRSSVFGQKSFRSLVDLPFPNRSLARSVNEATTPSPIFLKNSKENKQTAVVIVYDMRQIDCSATFQMCLIYTCASHSPLPISPFNISSNFVYLFVLSFISWVRRTAAKCIKRIHSGAMCARVENLTRTSRLAFSAARHSINCDNCSKSHFHFEIRRRFSWLAYGMQVSSRRQAIKPEWNRHGHVNKCRRWMNLRSIIHFSFRCVRVRCRSAISRERIVGHE